MNNQTLPFKQAASRFFSILLIVTILVSCQLLPQSTNPTSESQNPQSTNTETNAGNEPVPALPAFFQTELLNPLDTPHTYVEETCRYLRNKWNPLNAEPGTVVMVILFKNINPGTAEMPDSIRVLEFMDLMQQLKAQGFEAINARQLQAFLERNVEIPPRSVVLIQDGNRSAEYFDRNFREYFDLWGWPVINGWISEPLLQDSLLQENLALELEGFVDHQARGVTEDAKLSDESAKSILARELQGSLNGVSDQFTKTPTVIVWPNGGIGIRPVEVARQLRFKMGFTANSRGPIMYNWVPLADEIDPLRPNFIPEGRINDPLMTLPTFSPNEAIMAIDLARNIGKEASSYAQSNKEAEHKYYEVVCEEEYGPMPTP